MISLLKFVSKIFKLPSRDLDQHSKRVHKDLSSTKEVGQIGESYAASYLEHEGYRVVGSNFSLPVGRNRRGALIYAEIDLVAYDSSTLCFIEVKTRTSDWYATPEVNVDLRKQRQIIRAARAYRKSFGLSNTSFRYDVVTVVLEPEGKDGLDTFPKVEILRNFWTEDKFRKRRWKTL
jgi:putative endonuclease